MKLISPKITLFPFIEDKTAKKNDYAFLANKYHLTIEPNNCQIPARRIRAFSATQYIQKYQKRVHPLVVTDGIFGGKDEFASPMITIDDGDATIGLGNEQYIDLAPAGWTIIKRLARKEQDIACIVILVESATQTLLMWHEQVAMQGDHSQP